MPDETDYGEKVTLWHGTTRALAERIIAIGPDPRYRQRGETPGVIAEEFPLNVPGDSCVGSSEMYAKNKALLFPDEGGPVILEVDVPQTILNSGEWLGYWQFTGKGLQVLIREWPTLTKRICPL